ncbi:VP13C protein, partial [Turnix velox]|nr:VP13C protein [Turnix velox]
MVLESVVADLLNRFLGDYVENLNKSQLKLGIWGGNVALDNLQIKENALSELDVPFRIKIGQIDKLTLKIPWKNLYGEAVVATLEGLYLLIVPGASIKYDAEKEEKYLQDNKQKELARIEEALQKASEKGTHSQDSFYGLESLVYKDMKPGRKRKKYKKHFKRPFKGHGHSKDKPKEEKKDTFLEKLATQVIKNVQVKITGIHVRYEDDITDPQCPVSLGMTLSELSLLTTNESWTPSILNEAAKVIYKLLCLDGLSAYWNIDSKMYYHGTREQILDQLKRGIPCSGNEARDYQYIFRPVSASARLYINPYAEVELKTPKIDCDVEVQRIVIEFTKPQYLSMIDLLESIDYMVRNAPYRRFRPNVPLHKNAQQWWKYAGNSVLEVHIKRYTHMWSWSHINQHRQLLRSYKNMYKHKLTQTKLSEETQRQIQDLERKLDVFNIILARQQAQVETIRSGQKLLKKKTTEAEKKGGGWFSGLWGRRESKKKEDEESLVPETIDEIMTPEEKAKLFTAIGYSDSSHNLSLPKQYVAHIVKMKLLSTSLIIKEDKNVPETLKVQIIDLSTKISQRPGAQAIKVEAKLENWYVTGLRQQKIVPSLVASIGDSKSSLLQIEFNINPEDSPADQSLTIESQPVEIKYDAKTINAMVEFFQTSKGMDLERLTTATLMKLEEIKERTATGLAHIIEMRKVLDLKINLKPSYLVVPQTGFYHEKSDLLILDFGTFQLNSINQGSQASSFSSLEEIMDKAYDKFDVEIKNVQLLFGRAGEDWKKARFQHPSTLHLLQPMDIHVQLAKSMVERDTRMAKFKVSGGLPLVHVRLSDHKIKAIFDLIDSIPLPQKSSVSIPSTKALTIPTIPVVSKGLLNTRQLLAEIVSESEEEYFDLEESCEASDRSQIKGEEIMDKELAKEDLTDLQLKFEIKEVLVELTRQKKSEETVLVFDVMHLGTEATVRTYNLAAVSYLKKISLDYYETGGNKAPIHLISSSDKPGLDLLKVEYIKADRDGPHFQTNFDSTEQMIQVAFSSLKLLLHTEALLSAVSFLSTVSPSGSESRERPTKDEKEEDDSKLKKVARPSKDKDVFDFKLFAKLDAFCLNICDEKKNIAEIKIQGLDSSFLLQPSHMVFFARLKDIVVTDVDSRTLHKKAVSIVGDEVFSFRLTLDPYATEGEAYNDMSKVDGSVSLKVGCIQIIYLHKFLMSLLTFLNNFQTAKEALSAATVQAAEKAAHSVRDLAQRSFRLAMDIHLKAPVVVIPQSSISPNAIVIDLGLIKVQNQFSLVSPEGVSLPPVIDKMDVQLTKLKLSRTTVETGLLHPDIQILHPINLSLSVKRNLSATWFHELPVLEIVGYLDTMNVVLTQEDLSVILKVLTENLGEADEKQTPAKSVLQKEGKTKEMEKSFVTQYESIPEGALADKRKATLNADIINILLNFEIKEVVITLMKEVQKERYPLHTLTVVQLGTETKIRNHELTAAAYLKRIIMECIEINDSKGDPLCIINSSSETDDHLLKMEYIKADPDGPDFVTTYKSTKQNINVIFSCLDVVLHTEALLSIMSFLTLSIPSSGLPSTDKASDHKPQIKEQEKASTLRPASSNAAHDDTYELKLTAQLNAFSITVCDQSCSIADIRIQGMDASIAMKTKEIKVFSRLEDIVITNVDPKAIHKKAVSIMGDEVFRFQMSLYPDATVGEAYTDMSRVDGKMSLKVGCIQIIYLHMFFMSLLNFLNNFQTAQEALTAVTVQAAEMAASSMKDFAKKSFRLLMDVNLKAPVIVIPESSTSSNALVADLGLIRVQNEFKLVSSDESSLPPVIDNMDVQLTHLKLTRCILSTDSQPVSEILHPVSLTLLVQRNLAATWYHKTPTIGIKGDLKPMQIALSEDDLTVLVKILLENLGAASSQPNPVQENIGDRQIIQKGRVPSESDFCHTLAFGEKDVSTVESSAECYTALKFDFNFESLSVTLYNSVVNQKSPISLNSNKFCLGELRLHLMASLVKMFSDGSMYINIKLKACTLDDLREGIQNVTARMIDKKDDTDDSSMIDISYKKDKNEAEVVAVLDKLYVCASVEFLLAVADFFIKAIPASSTERSAQFQLKHGASGKSKLETEIPSRPNMTVKVVIMDPEIVFVANLTNADAPALKVSFQCDFSLTSGKLAQRMTAQVKGFKVLACAFLKEKQDKNVTTVVRPCSLVMENMVHVSGLQTVVVTVEELTVKISPIILNTVVTIMAAIKPKAAEEDSKGPSEVSENLWQVKPIDEFSAWFLGVDVATEAMETFRDCEHIVKQQKFDVVVKSVQITLECGLGHRTVPLLLVESVFSGVLKNWSSLMAVSADMSLEVHYYNETYAVWEPLIERIEGGKKQWSLKLEMKTNPAQERSLMPGDDFIVLPEPQTAVNISSKNTMNITISKCCLAVFSNLAKAFSEGTASTYDYSFKETAPFIVKNALGVPLKVLPSSNFRIIGSADKDNMNDVEVGQTMQLEYSVFEMPQRGKLSALHWQESSVFSLNLELHGYKEVINIPVAKPGRQLYNVRSLLGDHSDSIIVQIDATEGNKVITLRSPLQIKNHFTIPFMIYKLARDSKSLEPIGISKPDGEFHVPLHSYRCQLYIQPTGMLEGQFRESATYIVWKEELHRSNEVKCLLQCPAIETNFLPLIVSSTAVPDDLSFVSAYGEEWDPAYVIHLYPTLTVRNLLPYSLRYLLEGTAEVRELTEGSAADVFQSRINGEIMELVLMKYQGKDWNGHLKIHDGIPEFFSVCFTCHSASVMTVDLYIHTRRIGSRMILSVFSPYWIINKTSRILQYRAEDTHVKHPADYRDIVLFSFKKKNIFSKNKIQLCISTSTWSSSFSLDTVGSYGCVKCSANHMDYLV